VRVALGLYEELGETFARATSERRSALQPVRGRSSHIRASSAGTDHRKRGTADGQAEVLDLLIDDVRKDFRRFR
jgi:hypothetical protein